VRIALAGLGLIGTSLALDLRGLGHAVHGYEEDLEHLAQARAQGALDGTLASPEGAFDCIVLATPPRAALALLEAPWHAPLVLDACSVKAPLCQRARELSLPFVGGHPLTGGHGSGPLAARAGLFQGRGFALCPGGGPMQIARDLVLEIGARPFELPADEHDRIVARSSHLCHLWSLALAEVLQGAHTELMGPAAYEMLRVATSPTALWEEILELNATAVAAAVAEAGTVLSGLASGDAARRGAARASALRLREEFSGRGG